MVQNQNTYSIFCLYQRTGTTAQETNQSWNLANSLPELKVLVILSFPTVLRNGTSQIRKSKIYHPLLVFCKTEENSLFNAPNPIGVKHLNMLRLNFSHLNGHRFQHNFRDTVNPLCCCNTETETTSHYLLRCHLFSEERTKLLENLKNLDNILLSHCDDERLRILLCGSHKFSSSVNNKILSLTIEFLESTKRFDKPLF